MERYLAHKIIYRGQTYRMSVVTLFEKPDGTTEVRIEPFRGEIHSTSFHSGTIIVSGNKLIFS